MRELPTRTLLTGAKRQWSTPEVRAVPITRDILGRLRIQQPASELLAELEKKLGQEK